MCSSSHHLGACLQEKESVRTVMAENEKLLAEKRELLRRMSEVEDLGSAGMRTASTMQHRYSLALDPAPRSCTSPCNRPQSNHHPPF